VGNAAAPKPKNQADAFFQMQRSIVDATHPEPKDADPLSREKILPRCEREGGPNCILDSKTRLYLVSDMNMQASLAYTEYQAALQDARVELLLDKSSGWGLAGELLFMAAAAALTNGAGLIATDVGEWIATHEMWVAGRTAVEFAELAKTREQQFVGLVKNVVGAAKTPLRSKFAGYPRDVQFKESFIEELQTEAGFVFRSIVRDALHDGDDITIAMVRATFSKTSVAIFKKYIDDLLVRYADSKLDRLGHLNFMGQEAGTLEVVRVRAGQETRYALIEFRETVSVKDRHGERWDQIAGQSFVRWIDSDLENHAKETQLETLGTMRTLSADHPVIAQLPEIAEWRRRVSP